VNFEQDGTIASVDKKRVSEKIRNTAQGKHWNSIMFDSMGNMLIADFTVTIF